MQVPPFKQAWLEQKFVKVVSGVGIVDDVVVVLDVLVVEVVVDSVKTFPLESYLNLNLKI